MAVPSLRDMLLGSGSLAVFTVVGVFTALLVAGMLIARWRGIRFTAVVDRVVVYSVLATLLLTFYAGASLVATSLIPAGNTVANEIVAVAVALLVAATYAPASRLVQRTVDRLLYRDDYDYEKTLQRLSRELSAAHDHEAVVDVLLDGLVKTLNLTGAAYVSLPEELERGVLEVIGPDDVRARGVYSAPELRDDLLRRLAAMSLRAWRLTPSARITRSPWRGCAALFLIGGEPGEGVAAVMALGSKVAGAPLRREDEALLMTLAHQAATALANAQLVSGLRVSLQQLQLSAQQILEARAEQELLLRELVNAEERERAALARDLHDDALQEVLYTIRHAQLAVRLADTVNEQSERLAPIPASSAGPEDSVTRISVTYQRLRHELAELAERSAIAEKKLRALCLGLYPEMLPSLGLTPALEDLGEQITGATGMQVEVNYDDSVVGFTEDLAPDTALHLYRIAQEALTNAAKHGEATNALVRLSAPDAPRDGDGERDALMIEITDDGTGMALPIEFGKALAQGHLGLASMRERALLIHARLAFEAPEGGGTRITVLTPIRSSTLAVPKGGRA
ncbi:MAG TPA: ATP-binding protein [Ktedonobacterales bacterium]